VAFFKRFPLGCETGDPHEFRGSRFREDGEAGHVFAFSSPIITAAEVVVKG
jgi:hypothetical protein